MRKLSLSGVCGVVVFLLLWPGFSGLATSKTSEVADLKRELEKTRQLLDALTKKMEQLQDRLQKVEATAVKGEPVAPPPPETPRRPAMFQIPVGQRQLLLDIGITGDFVYNFVDGEKKNPRGAGTFKALEDRVFPREVEVSFTGRLDPYARADFFFEFAEEGEFEAEGDGFEREREFEVGIEEAYLTLLQLPLGLQARIGKMRPKFGRLNERHQHDLPQADRPNVLANFFGQEGLTETGAEISALLPTPFFQELSVGAFNGDNDESFGGRESFEDPLVTAHLRNFFELNEASALQVGLSGATGPNAPDKRTYLTGLDLTYKWAPPEEPYTVLTLQAEGLYSHRQTRDTDLDDKNRYGGYVFGDYRLSRHWGVGTRLGYSQFPEEGGREWAVSPYVTFWTSDFLRFRLQYKHTDRNFADAEDINEVFFQASFTLGHHPPHRF
ncbi:MAG: hypothetical protein ACE5G5_11390 [Candidatus Methylomirabilales bacterium]